MVASTFEAQLHGMGGIYILGTVALDEGFCMGGPAALNVGSGGICFWGTTALNGRHLHWGTDAFDGGICIGAQLLSGNSCMEWG